MKIQEKIKIINDYLKEHNWTETYVLKEFPKGSWIVEEPYFEIMNQSSPTRYSLDEFLEKIHAIEQDKRAAEIRKKEDAWIAKHKGTDGIASYLKFKKKTF